VERETNESRVAEPELSLKFRTGAGAVATSEVRVLSGSGSESLPGY